MPEPTQSALDLGAPPERARLIARYLHLTRQVMPDLAQSGARDWPVSRDHCFQRIVLDTLCCGIWYDHIPRPAVRHLTEPDAAGAIALCEAIIAGDADLAALNRQSLIWRGKLQG